MLSYGGVPLTLPTPKEAAWLSSTFSLRRLWEFQRVYWPLSRTPWLTFPGQSPDAPLKLGCLHWPRGASRFATFYAVVSDNVLAAIRAAGAPASALALTMAWGDEAHGTTPGTISTSLWMLPPLPLSQIGGSNGHSLLTLVDARYWWLFKPSGVLSVTENTTTWDDVYTALASALGSTLTWDTIDSAYLKPSSLLATAYESLPLLLDAVAYNVGQRIVVQPDGTAKGRSVLSGAADVAANLALPAARSLMAGGAFLPADVLASVPATAELACCDLSGGSVAATPYTASAATGGAASATKVFHDSAAYDGTNAAAIAALAARVALDFGAASTQLGAWKYAGIVPWAPEPLHDAVEWVYTAEGGPQGRGEASTRIIPAPWNDLTDQLLHATPAGSCKGCCDEVNTLTIDNSLFYGVTYETLTGTNNDHPVSTPKLAITASPGAATITGFVPPDPTKSSILVIWNVGANKVVLAHQNAGSAAANRIICPLHSDYTIWPDSALMTQYDPSAHRWRFDNPEIGAGDGSGVIDYAIRLLKFGAGLTYTSGGDGSALVTASGAALDGDNVALASNKSVGATFASVGADFPWTVPADGTYLINVQVNGHIVPHSMGPNGIVARLNNLTAGTIIGSATMVVYEHIVDEEDYGCGSITVVADCAAGDQIDLEAGYFFTGTPSTATVLAANTLSPGGTVLSWVKIA